MRTRPGGGSMPERIPLADRFSVIYADPPWKYKTHIGGTARTADAHYQTMSTAELAAFGAAVNRYAAPRCALFLWVTNPILPEGLEVMRSWGFRYVTVAFAWHKLTQEPVKRDSLTVAFRRLHSDPADRESLTTYGVQLHRTHFGMGHYTRSGAEMCLLGLRGSMPVADHSVCQVVHAPIREHSRKPDEVYGLIERLYPEARRLELFARSKRPGWHAFGNETDKFGVVEAVT